MVGVVLEIVERQLYLTVSSLKAMIIHFYLYCTWQCLIHNVCSTAEKISLLLITSLKMARLGTHEHLFPSLISPLVDFNRVMTLIAAIVAPFLVLIQHH